MSDLMAKSVPPGPVATAVDRAAFRDLDRLALEMVLSSFGRHTQPGRSMRGGLIDEIEALVAELAGPAPAPTVALLARSAALSPAELRRAESYTAFARGHPSTPREEARRARAVDRAHDRFLKTFKALAAVRRIESGAPAVQVNVLQAVRVEG